MVLIPSQFKYFWYATISKISSRLTFAVVWLSRQPTQIQAVFTRISSSSFSNLSHPLNKQTWSSVFFFSSPSVSFSWHDVRSPLLESMTKGCDLRMLQIRMKSDTQMSSLLSLMRRREEKSEINSFPSGLQSSCCFLLFLFFFLSSIHFREEKTNMCMILPLPDLLPLSWRNVTKNTRSEEKPYDEREKRLLIPPASLPSDKSPFPDLSIRGGRKLILQWFPAQQNSLSEGKRRF